MIGTAVNRPCRTIPAVFAYCGIRSRRVPTDRRHHRARRPVIELADYMRQHLGHDQPIIWSDLLADQITHVVEHWLTHDDDGQASARQAAHGELQRTAS